MLEILRKICNLSLDNQYEIWKLIFTLKIGLDDLINNQVKEMKSKFTSFGKIINFEHDELFKSFDKIPDKDDALIHSEFELLIRFIVFIYQTNKKDLLKYIRNEHIVDTFMYDYLSYMYEKKYTSTLDAFNKIKSLTTNDGDLYKMIENIINFLDKHFYKFDEITKNNGILNFYELNPMVKEITEIKYYRKYHNETILSCLNDLHFVINQIIFCKFKIYTRYNF